MLLGLAVSAQGMRAPDIVCLRGNMRKLLHLGLPQLGAHTASSESSEINIKVGMDLADPTLPSEETSPCN